MLKQEGFTMNIINVRKKLEAFLLEDIGDRDLTSEGIFPATQQGKGMLIAKDQGIIAGLPIIQELYQLLDPNMKVTLFVQDGEKVEAGDVLAEVHGPVVHLLTGERVALNLLQRMSGIATITKKCIDQLNDDKINICDTRKTMPGLRMFDKYAVTAGGGKNHRFGLYDGVLIKDNHIAFCGSITTAVNRVRESVGHMVKIEVETETVEEVQEAVEAQVDVIMFDNRSPDEIKEFVRYVPRHIITEASGGITIETLSAYAQTGVDYISLGFLTHSVKALDISLNVELK